MAASIYQCPAVQTPSTTKLREIAAKFGMDDMSELDLLHYQSNNNNNNNNNNNKIIIMVYESHPGLYAGAYTCSF